ncbi:MAG: ATP-binding protein [bacterium]
MNKLNESRVILNTGINDLLNRFFKINISENSSTHVQDKNLLLTLTENLEKQNDKLKRLNIKMGETTQIEKILDKKSREVHELNKKILFSKQQLEVVFDAIKDCLCVINKDKTIIRINRSYARLCKKSIHSLLGQKCYEVFLDRDKECNNCIINRTFQFGEAVTGQQWEIERNHEMHYYEMNAYPIFENRQILFAIEHIRDITEEKRMNDQLLHSANLASIGTMTAGIAHEINNPLSGISGNAENMLNMPEKYNLNQKGIDRVRTMLDSANRAECIMKNLLDLSRRKENRITLMDILPILNRSLQSILIPGFKKIKIDIINSKEANCQIQCDPAKIQQVFINLISNAVFAILEKEENQGRAGSNFEPQLKIIFKRSGNYLKIIFKDNGVGIPEDKLKEIFSPFYTTREPGKGTGLGLSICMKILLEHRGHITVSSNKSAGGTEFTVWLLIKNRAKHD